MRFVRQNEWDMVRHMQQDSISNPKMNNLLGNGYVVDTWVSIPSAGTEPKIGTDRSSVLISFTWHGHQNYHKISNTLEPSWNLFSITAPLIIFPGNAVPCCSHFPPAMIVSRVSHLWLKGHEIALHGCMVHIGHQHLPEKVTQWCFGWCRFLTAPWKIVGLPRTGYSWCTVARSELAIGGAANRSVGAHSTVRRQIFACKESTQQCQ